MEKKINRSHQEMMAEIAARQQMSITHTNTMERFNGEWYGRWEGTNGLGQRVRVFIKKIEIIED